MVQKSQIAQFKKTVRELEVDESEEVFDETLPKIEQVNPQPKSDTTSPKRQAQKSQWFHFPGVCK